MKNTKKCIAIHKDLCCSCCIVVPTRHLFVSHLHVDCPGNDISCVYEDIISAEACARLCLVDVECIAFVLYKSIHAGDFGCCLKSVCETFSTFPSADVEGGSVNLLLQGDGISMLSYPARTQSHIHCLEKILLL